jgi:hypothetical protein
MTAEEEENTPIGFMGRLRDKKVLTWIVIISFLTLTIGASTVAFVIQAILPGN